MDNNLYFNSHHPQGVSAKHAETTLKSAILRTSARSLPSPARKCLHLTIPPPPSLRTSFMDGPSQIPLLLPLQTLVALHLSDSIPSLCEVFLILLGAIHL